MADNTTPPTDPANKAVHSDAAHPHEHHEHRDPLTGAPGAHPLGTGVGAAGAGAAGAAIGAAAGPIGALAGAAVGAFVGGLIGKGVAEGIDPTEESAFWRAQHRERPYYDAGFDYDTHYEPAYRYGWETRRKYHDKRYDEVEHQLGHDWEHHKGRSELSWDKASHAVKDAWHRIEHRGHDHHDHQ